MLDLRAKDFVETQLDPAKPNVPGPTLREAIRKASQPARDEILERTKEARESARSETMANRIVPILRFLIESDTGNLYHRVHGQLGYALQDLGEFKESDSELTQAIQIRDRLRRRGWKYYELKRAVARIHIDTESPTPLKARDEILADLRRAYDEHSDPISKNREVEVWLKKNGLSIKDIQPEEKSEASS